jgi:hypothetical protein
MLFMVAGIVLLSNLIIFRRFGGVVAAPAVTYPDRMQAGSQVAGEVSGQRQTLRY